MTVAELIKLLKKVKDKEISVFVDGYEGGSDEVKFAGITKFTLNKPGENEESYYGDHEIKGLFNKDADQEAFYISRGTHDPNKEY